MMKQALPGRLFTHIIMFVVMAFTVTMIFQFPTAVSFNRRRSVRWLGSLLDLICDFLHLLCCVNAEHELMTQGFAYPDVFKRPHRRQRDPLPCRHSVDRSCER